MSLAAAIGAEQEDLDQVFTSRSAATLIHEHPKLLSRKAFRSGSRFVTKVPDGCPEVNMQPSVVSVEGYTMQAQDLKALQLASKLKEHVPHQRESSRNYKNMLNVVCPKTNEESVTLENY
jgi:hypothetical protein